MISMVGPPTKDGNRRSRKGTDSGGSTKHGQYGKPPKPVKPVKKGKP